MRAWTVAVVVTAMACGGGQEVASQDMEAAREQAEGAVAAILAGDPETQGPAVCDVLESGVVTDVFGVDGAAVTFRPGSKYVPQPLCTASWDDTEVSLTVMKDEYESAAAAVASLERAVAQLEEGITVTVQGNEHTTQVDFDDWMDGVGDKAAWAPGNRELLVAAHGVRFAVAVSGAGDDGACKAKAIEVARRVIDAL